jgi:hypothetical protein
LNLARARFPQIEYHNGLHQASCVDIVAICMMSALGTRVENLNAKFMQTLEKEVYVELKAMAKERGVTVQEFLRAVIVPDWMLNHNGKERRTSSRSRTS